MPRQFLILIIAGLLMANLCKAQNEDANWVFGGLCAVSFVDPEQPTLFHARAHNLEASASISDTAGNLQFYLSSNILRNFNDDTLLNGHDLRILGTYRCGMIILPFFRGSSKYHVFYSGNTDPNANSPQQAFAQLYHAIVDMSRNGGLGEVILKNALVSDDIINEGLSAVLHADGKSWWLCTHENGGPVNPGCSQRFLMYLITDEAIQGPFVQEIGACDRFRNYPGGLTKFSFDGTQMIYYNSVEPVSEIYNFDRCTGTLSNMRSLGDDAWPIYGAEFSPGGQYLYAMIYYHTGSKVLYQYDLRAADIVASRITIADSLEYTGDLNQFALARNGKIYAASWQVVNAYDALSVIHFPDRPGPACEFELFDLTFSFGGHANGSLPNMPNYNLPPIEDYVCLTAQHSIPGEDRADAFYPNPASNTIYLSDNFYEKKVLIADVYGNVVHAPSIFDSNQIDISDLPEGIYFLVIISDKQQYKPQKFIKIH